MGMMFTYTLSQCNDWKLCLLEKGGRRVTPPVISEGDPNHWHLGNYEGGDWIYKTRKECLNKLISQVNYHYDRLYDEEGNHRTEQESGPDQLDPADSAAG